METVIILVMVLLAIGALTLGATAGIPGVVKPPPTPKQALAESVPLRAGQVSQEAFAREAAHAVAARALTPRGEPDDSPGMQMKVMAGVLVSALVILAMGAYVIWEPTREADASARQLNENVDRGASLFATYCVACHNTKGQGFIGPDLQLKQLAARYKLNTNDPSDMAKLRTMVVTTITDGRPGTPMPTWGDQNGGALNETQISNLADLIMTNGWDKVPDVKAPAGAPAQGTGLGAPSQFAAGITVAASAPASSGSGSTSGSATPAAGSTSGSTSGAASGGSGDAAKAAQPLIAKYGCGGCHTIQGVPGMVGTVGPNLTHVASVPKIPESTGNLENNPDNLAKWIHDAPGVKPGTIMPNFSGQGMSLDDAKTIAAYLSTLK
ncbi:MAG TPA: cytochrome c [Chloroflexota bacterium]|nr:cytochrome c [Chloroflexota bacterium]